jgi:hypothetical protein
MRCSYDATRLSDNARRIECWFSQKVHHSICVPSSPNNAPLLIAGTFLGDLPTVHNDKTKIAEINDKKAGQGGAFVRGRGMLKEAEPALAGAWLPLTMIHGAAANNGAEGLKKSSRHSSHP